MKTKVVRGGIKRIEVPCEIEPKDKLLIENFGDQFRDTAYVTMDVTQDSHGIYLTRENARILAEALMDWVNGPTDETA